MMKTSDLWFSSGAWEDGRIGSKTATREAGGGRRGGREWEEGVVEELDARMWQMSEVEIASRWINSAALNK